MNRTRYHNTSSQIVPQHRKMLPEWYRPEIHFLNETLSPRAAFESRALHLVFCETFFCFQFFVWGRGMAYFHVSAPLGLARLRWPCRPAAGFVRRVRPGATTTHHVVPELHHHAGRNPDHDHQHRHAGDSDQRHERGDFRGDRQRQYGFPHPARQRLRVGAGQSRCLISRAAASGPAASAARRTLVHVEFGRHFDPGRRRHQYRDHQLQQSAAPDLRRRAGRHRHRTSQL